MECLGCGRQNPEGAKYCGDCGVRLPSTCSACGTANPPGHRFCLECGHRLASAGQERESDETRISGEQARTGVVQADVGERRHLTVMFCDLVGSTSLAERLDPEDLRQVVRKYQDVSTAIVTRFDGYVSQYLGDGILAYFGYPHAHEDDVQRSVRAALEIVAGVSELTAETGGGSVRLSVRIGIHSGFVVVTEVGSGARHEPLALGQTPNLAARLQDLAPPNRVVVSAEALRLLGHGFVCRDLGPQTIKGLTEPIRVFEVVSEAEPISRPEGSGASELTELIGREQELAILRECWEQVRDGYGQVVSLAGEAGIGKSRLVEALKQELAKEPCTRWECRCSPYHQDSAFHPIIDLFGRIFEFERDEPAPAKLKKLESGLAIHGLATPGPTDQNTSSRSPNSNW